MRSLYNTIAILAAVLALNACGGEVKPPKAPSAVSDEVRSERYLYHVSHAKLLLAQSSNKEADIERHRRYINELASGVDKKAASRIAAVELNFTLGEGDTNYTLFVPVRITNEAKFYSLDKIVRDLPSNHTFRSIKSYNVPMPMSVLSSLPKKDMKQQLDAIHANLTSRIFALTAEEQGQLHMHLTEYFLAKKMRDAAYISLENAKHAIAAMTEGSSAKAELLSQKSKELENRLNKQLPYKL